MSKAYVVPEPESPRLKMMIKGDTTIRDYAKFLSATSDLLDAIAESMGLPEGALMWMVETPSLDYEEAS